MMLPTLRRRFGNPMQSQMLTEIAGLDIRTLAERFGTPLFAYDRAVIEKRIADLEPFPVIRYAQKANSNLAILALMRRHGIVIDAISAGEIHRALKAGYRPADIVYTADVFDRGSLAMVEQLDIRTNCGSADMIRQLGARCPGREITLRINPGFGHGHSLKTNTGGEHSKHGIWHEEVGRVVELAAAHRLKVTGVHMHIGSGADFEHLARVADAMVRIGRQIGRGLTMISAGGGLPVPYREDEPRVDIGAYADVWSRARTQLETALGRALTLEIEPGRFLVAEAGDLVAEICAVKTMGRNTFYLVDAGFNDLARPILYGAYHPMSVCPAGAASNGRHAVVVAGRLCESGDIFTQREGGIVETRDLPKANVGDLLVIHCVGAYGFSMASNYNSSPLAAEVLISRGAAHLIRARQTLDDLTRGESIPADLEAD
jgi:diaminopimelate decarboxylase